MREGLKFSRGSAASFDWEAEGGRSMVIYPRACTALHIPDDAREISLAAALPGERVVVVPESACVEVEVGPTTSSGYSRMVEMVRGKGHNCIVNRNLLGALGADEPGSYLQIMVRLSAATAVETVRPVMVSPPPMCDATIVDLSEVRRYAGGLRQAREM